MRLELTIPMEPVAKGRPRVVSTKGGKVHAFTPDKTVRAEHFIASYLASTGITFARGTPLHITATFYRSRPKSLLKRVRLPISRPDTINLGALLCDALQKVACHDDAAITTLVLMKRFSDDPRIELVVEEDADEFTEGALRSAIRVLKEDLG